MKPGEIIKPYVTEEMAIDLAVRLYGLKVISINEMVSYDDRNFHILVSNDHQNPYIKDIAPDGYTLKVTNKLKSSFPDHFNCMHSVSVHVAKKGLRVPSPVRNLDGNTWKLENIPLIKHENVGTESANLCGVHLLLYIPGIMVSTLDYTKEVLYQWGRLLAQFQQSVEDLDCPSLFDKEVFWSLENIPEIVNFMDGLDEQKKTLVQSVIKEHSLEMKERIPNVRKGFIHGDFNENNVLARKSDEANSKKSTYSVDGVLDLEDMHYGTFVWDIGIMMAYSMLECKTMDPIDAAGYALAGYLSLHALTHTELSLIKMCMSSRLSQSLVLGAYSYKMDPQNSYLLVTARTGWQRLHQLCAISNDKLLQRWKNIQEAYSLQ